MADKHGWRRILGQADHTDPSPDTVVRLPRKSFEQLAAQLSRAEADREEHISELERLRSAWGAEMDRMSELIAASEVRIRATQEEIRAMLFEAGVVAKFRSDEDEVKGGAGKENPYSDRSMDG
jgi:hypothetical protein